MVISDENWDYATDLDILESQMDLCLGPPGKITIHPFFYFKKVISFRKSTRSVMRGVGLKLFRSYTIKLLYMWP